MEDGPPGGLSTLHANSAAEALARIEFLIGDAVDRVVHIRRTPEGRCVESVIAVNGFDGDGYRIERLA